MIPRRKDQRFFHLGGFVFTQQRRASVVLFQSMEWNWRGVECQTGKEDGSCQPKSWGLEDFCSNMGRLKGRNKKMSEV